MEVREVLIKPGMPDQRLRFFLWWLFCALCVMLYVRTFWIADDAFISFRHLENLRNGDGFGYNASERVQGYTNTLWTLVLAPLHMIVRNIWLEVFLSQLVLCAGLFYIVKRQLDSLSLFAIFVIGFLCSFSVWSYSSSGLENPLTNLLLVVFAVQTYQLVEHIEQGTPDVPTLRRYLITGAALFLNRYDHVLFCAPAIAAVLWICWRRGQVKCVLIASWPAAALVLGWLLFSLFYYASLVPNTAYAKLKTGLSAKERLYHGYLYWNSLVHTDFLGTVIIATLPPMLVLAGRAGRIVLAGVLLFLVYLTVVGGDHMLGRFFSAPVVAVLFILLREMPALYPLVSSQRLHAQAPLVLAGALALLALYAQPINVFMSPPDYERYHGWANRLGSNEIVDERSWWSMWSSPANQTMRTLLKGHDKFVSMFVPLPKPGEVVSGYAAGYIPYYAGRDVHFIDTLALIDPLLARLPSKSKTFNHYARDLPEGYLETLKTGTNVIADPDLHAYYDHLSIAIRGPLFNIERIKTAVGIAFGRWDGLIKSYQDRQ